MQQELPSFVLGRIWVHAGGAPEDFWVFCASAYYRAIPTVDISARIYAHAMTNAGAPRPAKKATGEPFDIAHVALALPYCKWLVVDGETKERLRRTGLDQKYEAEVFSENELERLTDQLNAI